ncbi:MAG: hypothetical protein ILP18_04495, partial [Treponema sp.]|nr:hypothetical protein [Treponema sp.]
AWRKGPVGIKLHQNNVKKTELRTGQPGFYSKSNLSAVCLDLPIDWGFGRFVRLEPCKVSVTASNAMSDGARGAYTLKAFLYESDGRLVREICSSGWIEAVFADGAIYNAGGKERWLILADPNAIGMPAFTMDIFEYQPVSHADIFSGLSIIPSELTRLQNLYNFRRACADIYEMENLGVCSYFPRVADAAVASAERKVNRAPIFMHRFRMGDVVNCKVRKTTGGGLEAEFFDDLVCGFVDKFTEPYYTSHPGDEIIFWGPHNARTVGLSLEALPRGAADGIFDNLYGTSASYRLVLSLYEEDGRWLRTLAEAPFADFVQDGIIVFEPLGIALRTPFIGRRQGQSAGPAPQAGGPSGAKKPASSAGRSASTQKSSSTPRSGSHTTVEARGGSREGTEYKPVTESAVNVAPIDVEKGHKSFDMKDRKPYGPLMKLDQLQPVRTLSEFLTALGL